jgi:hypothetical protein
LGAAALPGFIFPKADQRQLLKLQLLSFVAAWIPDIPLLLQIGWNAACGESLLKGKSPLASLWSNVLHSLVIWILLGVAFCLVVYLLKLSKRHWQLAGAVALGAFSHIVGDVFSHGNEVAFQGNSYLWPIPFKLGRIGFWNYANRHSLWPQAPEFYIMAAAIVLILTAYAWRRSSRRFKSLRFTPPLTLPLSLAPKRDPARQTAGD